VYENHLRTPVKSVTLTSGETDKQPRQVPSHNRFFAFFGVKETAMVDVPVLQITVTEAGEGRYDHRIGVELAHVPQYREIPTRDIPPRTTITLAGSNVKEATEQPVVSYNNHTPMPNSAFPSTFTWTEFVEKLEAQVFTERAIRAFSAASQTAIKY
jgi:hypothetical protein